MKMTRSLRNVVYTMALIAAGSGNSAVGQNDGTKTIHLGDFGGRPTVEVTINGAGPFSFILDTGSPSLIIDDSLAKSLGVEVVGSQRIGAPGGAGIDANVYGVSNVAIEGYELPVTEATGIDRSMMGGATGENRPHGVMSYWKLAKGVSVLDMKRRLLTVDPSGSLDANDPGVLALTRKPGFPFPIFNIRLGEETLEAHIDTGSPSMFTVDSDLADRLDLQGEVKEIAKANMVGREVTVSGASLSGRAVLGNLTIDHPEIRFIDRIPGVNVGSALLVNAIVRVDHEHDLISFTPSE